nr:asparagine synthetase B [Acetatifactor sp.]
MCSIAGFCNHSADYTKEPGRWEDILNQMNQTQKRRGPDESNILLHRKYGFAHNRLSILDPASGHQPMTTTVDGKICSIIYNGELYNMPALRKDL